MISFFKKKGSDEPDPGASSVGDASGGFKPDPKKAKRFIDHARTVADARNYDYAIECYINALKWEPDNLKVHEALREVALKRKAQGGKPAGFMDSMKHSKGKLPHEKMLNYEYQWSKDPFNVSLALDTMKSAHSAELEEITYWLGSHVIDANKANKRPSKATYLTVRDIYRDLGAFGKAVEACKYALSMDPQNAGVLSDLKSLQAEETMQTGRYNEKGGDFRDSIKDADKQLAMEQSDAIAGSQSVVDKNIENARANLDLNPEDPDAYVKLANNLLRKEVDETENEAIELLKKVHEMTEQYRFLMRVGDIKIKQINRRIRGLQEKAKLEPRNPRIRGMLKEMLEDKIDFELNEYAGRAKEYPTDMSIRYNLGRRQFAKQMWDDAIGSFQLSQNDPKYRVMSLRYLGSAFAKKNWYNDAIDIYRRAIETHTSKDDRTALDLQYELMTSLEARAREDGKLEDVDEALKISSGIAQRNINFKDIRERVEVLRKLKSDMRDAAQNSA